MSKSQQESHVVAVRLSTGERNDLVALAAIEGKSVSAYVRGLLAGAKLRPRPVLAAAGELLAICAVLVDALEQLPVAHDARAAVEENARRVITILRLHGQGTVQ